jgi:uncharacterized protein (UPF0147 family)
VDHDNCCNTLSEISQDERPREVDEIAVYRVDLVCHRISFLTEVSFSRYMPDLAAHDAIYDVVSNMETPEMTMVANGNRRQLGLRPGSPILKCPNN